MKKKQEFLKLNKIKWGWSELCAIMGMQLAASIKQFPQSEELLPKYKCHSFPNLKNGLITALLPQNTHYLVISISRQ